MTEPDPVGERKGLSARLQEIGWGGIARRARHRLRRRSAAAARDAWRRTHVSSADPERALAAVLPGGDVAAALDAPPDRFFLPARDGALRRAFGERHPAALDAILREADATLAGDWSWIAPGARADWHAALPGPERWPRVAAGETGIGAAHPIGDVRLAWEVGRCTQLVRVAQAAWCTGDARYAEAIVALGRDFASANPPGVGIAWEHAQEAALRAVAWLWAYRLGDAAGAFDDAARRLWLNALLVHGDYVAAHLADHPVTHNHLVSEAAGLCVLGLGLPAFAPAARWRAIGLPLLWRELAKQVDDEGVHGEHSTHYHGFVLDSFLAVWLLAERCGVATPAAARAKIEAMAVALALWLREDGTLPAIGDTDAGRAFRLGGDPLDRRDTLAAAAVAFGRRDLGAIAGDAPGAFWLTGGRSVPGADDAPPPGRAQRFDAAGIGIARTGFGRDAEILLFRAGPTRFRPDVLRAHMHADALSLIWRIGGDDVLVDPGTYLYSEGEGFRVALRRTGAHSCVVVDGRDQADVTGQRFGIAGERGAQWLRFEGDAAGLVAAAEHPASGALRVRRRIAWRPGALVVCDDVFGAGAHAVTSWLALPPSRGGIEGASAALALASGRALRIDAFGDVARAALVRPDAQDAPGPAWIAPRYGVRVPGTAMRIDADAAPLPRRIVTAIQSAAAGVAIAPARFDAAGNAARVRAGALGVRFDGGIGVAIEDAT